MPRAQKLYDAVREEAATIANVHFHGPIPYAQISQFYERARICVSTSDIEGFPNSYLQAWAHGTPVVAFLDPDRLLARNGLGRAATSIEELCAGIQALTTDPHEWQGASLRSAQYIDSRFSAARMVAPYIEALSELRAPPAPASASTD